MTTLSIQVGLNVPPLLHRMRDMFFFAFPSPPDLSLAHLSPFQSYLFVVTEPTSVQNVIALGKVEACWIVTTALLEY